MIGRATLALLIALPAWAQDPAPLLLRATIAQQGPVWVGQRVTVTLTVMTPARFVDTIAWPDLAASSGRIIVLPETSTVPGTERVDGRSYAALMRSYSVFPAAPGEVVIAPLALHLRVGGADGQPVEASATTGPLRLAARLPPGVADASHLVVAPAFSMRAETEGNAAQIHVGEALTRTITMQADDTAAMLLPPITWQAPDGVRVYADPPVLQDHSDRGTLRALRRDRAAFVPQRPGAVELPGFAVSWLDPRRGQVQQVTVPALRLDVLPAARAAASRRVTPWPAIALVAVAAALLLAAGWWLLRRRHASPPDGFATLRAACRAGEPRAALRALYGWADAMLPAGGERTLARLAALAETPVLNEEARRLEAVVFGGGGDWHGGGLAASAEQARQRLHRRAVRKRNVALPPLNPYPASSVPPRLSQRGWVR